MRRHFDETTNLANADDEEVQRDEEEMENNETEEEESKNDESDPEDESHLTLQELFDNKFERDLGRQLEQNFGSVSFTVVRR
jgi:hypothetical protein